MDFVFRDNEMLHQLTGNGFQIFIGLLPRFKVRLLFPFGNHRKKTLMLDLMAPFSSSSSTMKGGLSRTHWPVHWSRIYRLQITGVLDFCSKEETYTRNQIQVRIGWIPIAGRGIVDRHGSVVLALAHAVRIGVQAESRPWWIPWGRRVGDTSSNTSLSSPLLVPSPFLQVELYIKNSWQTKIAHLLYMLSIYCFFASYLMGSSLLICSCPKATLVGTMVLTT